jgi:hypothetical protein
LIHLAPEQKITSVIAGSLKDCRLDQKAFHPETEEGTVAKLEIRNADQQKKVSRFVRTGEEKRKAEMSFGNKHLYLNKLITERNSIRSTIASARVEHLRKIKSIVFLGTIPIRVNVAIQE